MTSAVILVLNIVTEQLWVFLYKKFNCKVNLCLVIVPFQTRPPSQPLSSLFSYTSYPMTSSLLTAEDFSSISPRSNKPQLPATPAPEPPKPTHEPQTTPLAKPTTEPVGTPSPKPKFEQAATTRDG